MKSWAGDRWGFRKMPQLAEPLGPPGCDRGRPPTGGPALGKEQGWGHGARALGPSCWLSRGMG